MDKVALVLVLFSGLFHVIRDLFIKNAKNKEMFLWLYLVVGLLIYFPCAMFFLVRENFTVLNVSIVVGSSVVHSFYLMALARAYSVGELSHVYPIARSAPLLILIFAVLFLGEEVSLLGVLGIIAITFGVYIMNAKALNLRALLEPIRSIPKEPTSKKLRK